MSIQVHPEKGIVVRVPFWTDESRIQQFIFEKKDWILKAQKKIETIASKGRKPISYMGEPLTQEQIDSFGGSGQMAAWYKQKAERYLLERTRIFAKILGKKAPEKVEVKSYKSRWGSCDRRNNISYNWKIMMEKAEVIDYLVAHEVSHMEHKNHSRDFYKTLQNLDPDYKNHKKILRESRI